MDPMLKRSILVLAVLMIGYSLAAQSLVERTRTLANSPDLKGGRLAFHVHDLDEDSTIVSFGSDNWMIPASSLKLITAYAAWDILGPDNQFETHIGHTGHISPEGDLMGDLIIKAGGDPSLGAERFAESYASPLPLTQWVIDILKSAGIRSIHGDIVIDESYYDDEVLPDGWTWQDIGNYYAAGSHAFSFMENRSVFHFDSRSEDGSTRIRGMEPSLEGVDIVNLVKGTQTRSDQAYVYCAPFSNRMYIRGEIPQGRKDFQVKVAIPEPAIQFREMLIKDMRKVGIEMHMRNESKEKQLDIIDVQGLETIVSPTLAELLSHMLLKSDNVIAEHMVKQIDKKLGGKGSTSGGLEKIRSWMDAKGVPSAGIVMRDGSGLSRSNSIKAATFFGMLQQLQKEPYAARFKKMLPVAGQSGSMSRVGKGTALQGNLKMKTGYLDRVRSYVGFLEHGGKTYSVVAISNDYNCSASQMRIQLTKLFEQLTR